MENQEKARSTEESYDPCLESLKYQLELVMREIQSLNATIARMDEVTQTTKNWAILTWGGSIGIALGEPTLRRYILLTAFLPFLFWYIDASWRYIQRRASFRIIKISEFLNDERLVKSFEQKKLIGFTVLDPTVRQYKDTEEYKQYTSIAHTLKFREVRVFYLALIGISLLLGVFFLLIP